MLSVIFVRSKTGLLIGFKASGHAGYSAAGTDIVCAGASALIQSAVLGITGYLGLDASVKADDGHMELHLPADLDSKSVHDVDIILNTIRLGLEQISEQYPKFIYVR